jgi:hypothetical protein
MANQIHYGMVDVRCQRDDKVVGSYLSVEKGQRRSRRQGWRPECDRTATQASALSIRFGVLFRNYERKFGMGPRDRAPRGLEGNYIFCARLAALALTDGKDCKVLVGRPAAAAAQRRRGGSGNSMSELEAC